jgi:hypothetical protein
VISASTAEAALIINRPLYVGLVDGLVGYWFFDVAAMFSTVILLDIAFAFAIFCY